MSPLTPCPNCARHAKPDEGACLLYGSQLRPRDEASLLAREQPDRYVRGRTTVGAAGLLDPISSEANRSMCQSQKPVRPRLR